MTNESGEQTAGSAEERLIIPQAHGGALHPWPKGVSGNPAGRPRNPAAILLHGAAEDEETARALVGEYIRLCLHARSEGLRASMLKDLMDRCGVTRNADGRHAASAVAQVANIIRGSPDLGV